MFKIKIKQEIRDCTPRKFKGIRLYNSIKCFFPDQWSWLRLITAVLQKMHEGWITGRKYINFENNETEESRESSIYRKKVA
ncbi:MAG: hypothetical protein J7L08_03300 [Candidatus Aenigmarchaeota archaeon]|nr:hypothetical protein [Candidatus Aenigmarchaeota archaeon]